jgi:hypothetical protein
LGPIGRHFDAPSPGANIMAAGAVVAGWLYEHARSTILVLVPCHANLNMVSATKGSAGLVQAVVSATIIGWALLILRADTPAPGGPIIRPMTVSRAAGMTKGSIPPIGGRAV